MHLAICVWGLLRALRFTSESIQSTILQPLVAAGHSFEIFLHTYRLKQPYRSLRNREGETKLNVSDWQLLRPNYVYIEDQAEFDSLIQYEYFQTHGDPWRNNYTSFKNHLRALNSLQHITLVVEHLVLTGKRHYDAVVFLRPDTMFLQKLPIYLLQSFPDTLFVPDFHRSCHGDEYNDRMAMGNAHSALIYGKKFEAAHRYSLEAPLHAEALTYWHLRRQEVKVLEMPFRFRRIRSSGEIHHRDFEAIPPSEQQLKEIRGDFFVGINNRRTPWYLRCLYTLLEMVTFYQLYIWNHDDHGNVFCRPHPHITYEQQLEIAARYGVEEFSFETAFDDSIRKRRLTEVDAANDARLYGEYVREGKRHGNHFHLRSRTDALLSDGVTQDVHFKRRRHYRKDGNFTALFHRNKTYVENSDGPVFVDEQINAPIDVGVGRNEFYEGQTSIIFRCDYVLREVPLGLVGEELDQTITNQRPRYLAPNDCRLIHQ